MFDKQKIEDLIADNSLQRALECLDHNIECEPQQAHWWYLRGKVYWRLGKRANAISDYEEAVHISPDSPAAHALAMSRSIMDFYNPDLLNP